MTELILALDVTEKKKALAVAHACAPHVDAIKLGYPLILSCGLSMAKELEEVDLPLIADFKVADIPNTNRLIVEQVFDAGFSSVICHGFTGKDAIQACVDTTSDYGGACFVVAEMSHPALQNSSTAKPRCILHASPWSAGRMASSPPPRGRIVSGYCGISLRPGRYFHPVSGHREAIRIGSPDLWMESLSVARSMRQMILQPLPSAFNRFRSA